MSVSRGGLGDRLEEGQIATKETAAGVMCEKIGALWPQINIFDFGRYSVTSWLSLTKFYTHTLITTIGSD